MSPGSSLVAALTGVPAPVSPRSSRLHTADDLRTLAHTLNWVRRLTQPDRGARGLISSGCWCEPALSRPRTGSGFCRWGARTGLFSVANAGSRPANASLVQSSVPEVRRQAQIIHTVRTDDKNRRHAIRPENSDAALNDIVRVIERERAGR